MSLTGLFQADEDSEVEFQPADKAALQDTQIVDDERDRTIARAIAALPEKYRVPIILRDIEGKSYDEVAEIMGLGLGTTKSRISRGRGLLREKLEHYF